MRTLMLLVALALSSSALAATPAEKARVLHDIYVTNIARDPATYETLTREVKDSCNEIDYEVARHREIPQKALNLLAQCAKSTTRNRQAWQAAVTAIGLYEAAREEFNLPTLASLIGGELFPPSPNMPGYDTGVISRPAGPPQITNAGDSLGGFPGDHSSDQPTNDQQNLGSDDCMGDHPCGVPD